MIRIQWLPKISLLLLSFCVSCAEAPSALKPVPNNPFIAHYARVKREAVEQGMKRFPRYQDFISKELAKENLPPFLMILPALESGFRPDAVSSAGAKGLWQFMPETGRQYGLRVDEWVDERLDPFKATQSAVQYLKRLYQIFEDWEYALTSYNAGEGRVSKALKVEYDYKLAPGFWKLELRAESRDYYPKFVALVTIYRNREEFGFDNIEVDPPLNLVPVQIPTRISLAAAAQYMEVDIALIKQFNLFLIQGAPPPNESNYTLYIPSEFRQKLLDALALPAEATTVSLM